MIKSPRWGLVFVLTLVMCISASAQDTGGPALDTTPMQIPAVAKTSPRPVTSMDLLTIRDPHGLSISPDGQYLAFVVGQAVYDTNSYRSVLFVIGTAPGSLPVCLGSVGLPQWDEVNRWMEEAPKWSSDSQYIMHRMRMATTDSWQVWRWNREGGQPIQVTRVKGDVLSYDLAPDGSKILLTVQLPRSPAEAERLAASGILYDGITFVNRNRSIVSEVLDTKPPKTETWIHQFTSGEERIASAEEIELFGPWESDLEEKVLNRHRVPLVLAGHHILDAKISPDRHLVAYRFLPPNPSHSKAVYQLLIKPVHGGTPSEVQLPADAYYIPEYWWSPDSSKLYYINSGAEQHPAKLFVVSASGGPPEIVFDGTAYTSSWSLDRETRYMACHREDAFMPGGIAVVDLTTGNIRQVVDLNPEFHNIKLSAPIRIEGVNKFGDAWFAHVVKPLDYQRGKRYPTIVTTYRSGDYFLRGASGDASPIQVYAAHGFAVLSFDFGRDPYARLRPGNFDDFVVTESSPVASIEMAIQKGVDMGIVDPARVGITGYSRGTEITAYAITHTNLFRAASGAAGDGSPFFYYMAPNWMKTRFASWGLGGWPEGEVKSKWKELAPDLGADRIHVPLLNNDPDSEFLNDLSLYTSLKELGKPVEMFIYANEGHTINQPKHRYEIYERNVDWFRFWLKREESQDPNKREQYERWHHLRQQQLKADALGKADARERAKD